MKFILSAILVGWAAAMFARFYKRMQSGQSGRRKGLIYNQYSNSANVQLSREENPLQFYFFTYIDLVLAILALAGAAIIWFIPLQNFK